MLDHVAIGDASYYSFADEGVHALLRVSHDGFTTHRAGLLRAIEARAVVADQRFNSSGSLDGKGNLSPPVAIARLERNELDSRLRGMDGPSSAGPATLKLPANRKFQVPRGTIRAQVEGDLDGFGRSPVRAHQRLAPLRCQPASRRQQHQDNHGSTGGWHSRDPTACVGRRRCRLFR